MNHDSRKPKSLDERKVNSRGLSSAEGGQGESTQLDGSGCWIGL